MRLIGKKSKLCFFIIGLFFVSVLIAQEKTIRFECLMKNEPLELTKAYKLNENDSVIITTFRFYISHLTFYNGKKKVFSLPQNHCLIDVEKPPSMVRYFPTNKRFNQISFQIGVDSTANANAAMDGDLDPINGMYWTWQSGFIQWKLEGSYPTETNKKNSFQFHIGGFQSPFQSTQTATFDVDENTKDLVVKIDLEKLWQQIDLKNMGDVMSPNAESAKLSRIFKTLFTIHYEK